MNDLTKEQYDDLVDFARRCMNPDDPVHGMAHVFRVEQNCLWLCDRLATRRTDPITDIRVGVLRTAAILHDNSRAEEDWHPAFDHAKAGAKRAQYYLSHKGYDPAFVAAVCHAIACHRYKANIKPTSVEAKILQDADRMDCTGVWGIVRNIALSTTTTMNTGVYKDRFCDWYKDKPRHVITMVNFHETEQEIAKRLTFMEKFMHEWERESVVQAIASDSIIASNERNEDL